MDQSAKQFYAKFCFTLNPDRLLKIKSLTIVMKPNLIYQHLEVKLNDVNPYAGRHIVAHSVNHKGDKISITPTSHDLKVFYADLSQVVYVEEDPTNMFRNYLNIDFETYNECDRQSALSDLTKEISPDFYPYWAAPFNNFTQVTTEPIFLSTDKTRQGFLTHLNYVSGVETENSTLPCNNTKKNPAYGRQSISRPMRIVAPIPQ